METILFVGRESERITSILNESYYIIAKNSIDEGLITSHILNPDIAIVDMVGLDTETASLMKKINDLLKEPTPVIMIGDLSHTSYEDILLENGAADYITKPFSDNVLKQRIRKVLSGTQKLKSVMTDLMVQSGFVNDIRQILIHCLTNLTEGRDAYTGGHINRTLLYVKTLINEAVTQGVYREILNSTFIGILIQTAPLHDIGKVAISDLILNKPAKLEPHEFEIMKLHASVGGTVIEKALTGVNVGYTREFFMVAKDVIKHHHEKWDGTGYPDNLREDKIPLSARFMSIADVYDALVSERPYKAPFSHEKATAIIREGKGNYFDPVLVDIFNRVVGTFESISQNKR